MTYIIIILALLIIGFYLMGGSKGTANAYKSISASEAREMLKGKKAVFLDVRTPAETRSGMIPGAKTNNVTSPSFVKGLAGLDNTKEYVVYCRSGKRSARACQIMKSKGFDNLHNLEGGFNAWK